MSDLVVLLAPSANRVYAGASETLVSAELAIMLGTDQIDIAGINIAGVGYLQIGVSNADTRVLASLGKLSAFFAMFSRDDRGRLTPLEVVLPDLFDADLVTIPKYPGKTNEQFTRLLMNVALASSQRTADAPATILDPLAGRGTTLSTGLILGHDVAGVEGDLKAIEAHTAFLKTYLRRKRLKHTIELNPVRRDGKILGRRLDASITPASGGTARSLTLFSGDTRQSGALYGKRRFDAVITDAPYGVVHGSQTDVRGVSGKRDRSPAGLLADALPVWTAQLRTGGVLGLSWNTLGLTRERLTELAVAAGLTPCDEGPYLRLAHRVDSSVHRDVFVAIKRSVVPGRMDSP